MISTMMRWSSSVNIEDARCARESARELLDRGKCLTGKLKMVLLRVRRLIWFLRD